MSDDPIRFDLDVLLSRVAEDAGAPEFPAAAEALRRTGNAERARDLAEAGLECAPSRLAGRVALALAEMDLGRPARGRDELEKVLDEMLAPYRLDDESEAALTPTYGVNLLGDPTSISPEERPSEGAVAEAEVGREVASPTGGVFDSVEETEFDAAFDEAEARPEEMHSPNRMAESILDSEAPFEADVDDRESVTLDEADAAEFDLASSGAFATHTMAGLLERQGDHARARTIRSSLDIDPLADESAEDTVEATIAPDPDFAMTDALDFEAEAAQALEADRMGSDAGPEMEASALESEHRGGTLSMDAAEAPIGVEAIPAQIDADEARSARIVATLETWLHNLTRGVS